MTVNIRSVKYILLTIALGLCIVSCTSSSGSDVTEGPKHYDPSRPPLVKGQFSHVQSAYCAQSNHGGHTVVIWIFDSTGAPLPQFTIKALKKPYGILANNTYFNTDQNGEVKVTYQGCDSLELANLSFLTGKACRIGTANMPDTLVITLALTQEKFIPSTM